MLIRVWLSFIVVLYIGHLGSCFPSFKVSQYNLRSPLRAEFDPILHKAEVTRDDLVQLIDESWLQIKRLIGSETLQICEDDLRGATSLLVLATLRRAADEFSSSRSILEWMLRSADRNNDGQLSYAEWFDWLTQYSHQQIIDGEKVDLDDTDSWLEGLSSSSQSWDPMVRALGLLVGHALCSLRVVARMSRDPSTLCAAFVAGALMTNVLDANIKNSMLSRLAPQTR
jgi:hypothetical protein